ncbi:MAG: beta-N-acetylglucosaminidase [Acidobacteria bacterium]|nr:MAG: beta-N-acetylglucosaminidase [Acidobacteriota bacterium]REK04553.1 MAG: beta-N-acetylglucosaminidase [Acidobacteriota bacterium]
MAACEELPELRRPAGRATRLAAISCIALGLLCAASTAAAQPAAAESTAAGLAGQVGALLLPRVSGTFLADDDPELQRLIGLARDGRIGGAVFFAGDPLSVRHTAQRLQQAAPRRLLFGLDAEWGAAMRLEGATRWPRALAVGATGDPDFAYEMGRTTARESLALGIELVLAPVADLMLRADNQVIGNRAFGGDPSAVGEMVAAFVRGVESAGAIAVVKHFPGHGATADDSHATLPVLDVDSLLLEQRELVPFRAAIDAGVSAVMPGHLAIPEIDPSGAPASLSPILLGEWLRSRLGFTGLVVSDALDMQGAREFSWDGRVAARALAAGVDLMLLPTHPEAAHAEILRAVSRGELAAERVVDAHHRLARLLADKREGRGASPVDALATSAAAAPARAASRAAITVIGDAGTLPLPSWDPPHVALIEIGHHPQRRGARDLERALHRRTSVERFRVEPLAAGSAYTGGAGPLTPHDEALARADVVALLVLRGGPDWCRDPRCDGLQPWTEPLLRQLGQLQQSGKTVLALGAADPWPLLAPEMATFAARLTAHDHGPESQEALAAALFGEQPIGGKLPLSPALRPLPPTRPLPAAARAALRRGSAQEAGMSPHRLERAAAVLERAVEDGATPGAVALVARRGVIVFERAFGRTARRDHLPQGFPTDRRGRPPETSPDTLYDLASLTKVVATTTLAMRLVEAGRLELDRPVADYLPEILLVEADPEQRAQKSAMTVRHLLTHSSGALWWTDLHLRHGVQGGNSPDEARRAYLEEIYRLPLESAPGEQVVYSDLGILLLGEILERAGGAPYAELVRREVLEPLGMRDTTFAPPETQRSRIAPTEYDPWRGRVVWGEVHDENAAGLGGVAPHAGLFSTAADLAKFGQAMLSGGIAEGERFLSGRIVDRFTRRAAWLPDGSTRALGWDTPSPGSSGGRYVSSRAFGHTGFTGTSLWIDPEHELLVVLLTNRVHPSRDDQRIRGLRPAFHDAVLLAIDDQPVEARAGSQR